MARGSVPPDQPQTLCHGDYKLDNVLFAPEPPPRLLAVVDWEMASIGDPLVDLAWALIFHPGPEGTMPLGTGTAPVLDQSVLPSVPEVVARYAERSGRDVSDMAWYHVFSRWKLGIVLEGRFAKWQRGRVLQSVSRVLRPTGGSLARQRPGVDPLMPAPFLWHPALRRPSPRHLWPVSAPVGSTR